MDDLEREREIKDRLIDHMQKNNIKQVDVAKETGQLTLLSTLTQFAHFHCIIC